MRDLRSIARALDGDVSGHEVTFPGPGHSREDRSASVRFDPQAPGGFLVNSFAGDDPLAIKDYVRARLGLDRRTHREHKVSNKRHLRKRPADHLARTDQALSIWRETCGPRSTPVATYLERRGVELLDSAVGEAIRFHPNCPFWKDKRTPAMVCLVRDILTNEPKAIHRTALDLEGHKVKINGDDRLSLAPIRGGAIKLTPDEDVTTCLGVGEGLENTLSLRLAPEFGPSPVWSLISSGGVGKFPVLPGIECLWIAVDRDPSGENAAKICADRWRKAGREVFLVKPSAQESDLNDVFQGVQHA